MNPDDNDPLLRHLLELVKELDASDTEVILGGGMGLYLRLKYMAARTPRYPFDVPIRSTNDLDIFLSSDLIVDLKKMVGLQDSLARLGYEVDPKARNFQFQKDVQLYGQARKIKVDLLAAPPSAEDKTKVKINGMRIKPAGAEGIHAYLTNEAAGIHIGQQAVDIGKLDAELKLKNAVLFLPSAYNHLILKLHAFEDRKDKDDAKSNLGRHHALDIFATVVRMGETDWATAKEHFAKEKDQPYLLNARRIRKENFRERASLGLLRIRDNEAYRGNQAVYDAHLDAFIADLAELFPD